MQKYFTIYTKNNMKGLVGALCWWGTWGPGPLSHPTLKSGHGPSSVGPQLQVVQ